MKTAIILHGMPDKEEYYEMNSPSQSNRHWFPWLQKQLILKDVLAQTPEMPVPYEPKYEAWKEMFERFSLDENTLLVGHSLGAGFLVRWLSETDKKIGRVILVAPWLDPTQVITPFFDFEIDQNLSRKTKSVDIFVSSDDFDEVKDSVKILKDRLTDVNWIEMDNKGHFCFDDLGGPEFPELLDVVLK